MAAEIQPQPLIDHLVVLVSHATLLKLPDQLQDSFVVAPGGTHTGGATLNKLILFQDGFYVELIAFAETVDPEKRKNHRWGRLEENQIIDFAYSLTDERDFKAVQQRVEQAGTPIRYSDPIAGGRTTDDGTVLKWAVAEALDESRHELHPGKLPFWCLDRTPRKLRVPFQSDPEKTQHPSGASGISSLSITVDSRELGALSQVYDAIHDSHGSTNTWHFGIPSGDATAKHALSLSGKDRASGVTIVLRGNNSSPAKVEIVPGVIFELES
ncbi:hypothetical protein QQS21_009208 [Conoideocrella luteorostrata]|uniref:Glyoxalase-like domain-containing protein n=1 Tax=Conoideocrella luteorostrata TaxID=1105319 RepID=A0AAJ0CHC0_9HYPO|nr:hypothetical protein QQS21_009208 [Conoideocrella luteorostrata]